MDNRRHCQLCENRKFDLQTGTYCGLTNEKPNFVGKCSTMKLGQNAKDYIKRVNIEYQKVELGKNLAVVSFVIYLLFSIMVAGVAYFIADYIEAHGAWSLAPFLIYTAAIALFGYGAGYLIPTNKKKGLPLQTKGSLTGWWVSME